MPPPIAFLLHGYLGTGKTTLARQFEQTHAAVRFTHDEWMSGLYGADPPATGFEAAAERVSALMEVVWTRCLRLGVNVVLDSGFWSRDERDRVRGLIADRGGRTVLYRLSCPDDVALLRIAHRNECSEGGLFIAPETYRVLRSRFEPLSPDEERVEIMAGDES